MDKVKVLQMPLRNNRGGIAKYILENWRFIDRSKFTFDFITFEKQIDFSDELLADGCKIHNVSCLPSEDKKRFYSEIHAILDEGYDAIHLHTSQWSGTQLEEIAMERGIPNVIVHSHNITIAVPPEETERYYASRQLHESIKREFSASWRSYATNLCACSDMAARWLFGDELADSEVYVLKNAVDIANLSFNKAVREKYRKELSLQDSFVIGHVGRFDPQKNHEFVLRLFKETAKTLPSAHLLLIGGGAGFDETKALANEYGIASKVSFLGMRGDVAELMQSMDAFVLPSFFEGLPITLVEAQTAGLRCLASNAISLEAKIKPDTLFLPLEVSVWRDALLETARNGYDRVDAAAFVTAAGYSIRESVKVVEKLYRGLLKSEPGEIIKL